MKRALIIVDHGSRLAEANDLLEDVARMLRDATTDRVYTAHMELAEPTIGQAFDAAVADGADHVFIFPYFLAPGRHSRQDIPRMCAAAAAKHPGVRWHCGGPIGLDPALTELILRRVQDCEAGDYVRESVGGDGGGE
jgi:sirohydrochlorin ferrochelatase